MLKYALLGLLAQRPRHGYELKAAFEELLGGTWPLNIGQVYTTMGRLERDGLVRCEVVEQDPRPDRKVYSLTETGEKELDRWLAEPVGEPVRLKDELFLKLLLHGVLGTVDPTELIATQRQRCLDALAELTDLQTAPSVGQATALLLEGAILHLEADIRWLDRCDEVLPF